MNLYYKNTSSKCNWIMDSLSKGWPDSSKVDNPMVYYRQPAAFWGFIQNNWDIIKKHQQDKIDWWFWDMPYYKRWQGNSDSDFYWRVSKNCIHETQITNRPSDRFDQWNLDILSWNQNGSHILVCPSSATMTRWATGETVENWVNRTVGTLKRYTDREIRVRYKPRANGTSGPRAEAAAGMPPFSEDIKNAHACVTSVSLCAVESISLGVPIFCDTKSFAFEIGETDLSKIETPKYKDREPWFYHLAYQQFNHREIENGTAYRLLGS